MQILASQVQCVATD